MLGVCVGSEAWLRSPVNSPCQRLWLTTWRPCTCNAGRFSYGESPRTPPLEGTSLHRWNNSVERPWGILSLFTTCLHAGVTVTWRLCKAGRFSYGESPRTPPLEGTSLHRWNNSVERPWGILSLFTTCLHAGVTVTWRLCKAGRFSYGESPWTPPLEGTSLHRWNNSVERPWGILSLFTTCLHAGVTVTWRLCKAGRFSYGESPRTPPLEGTSLHRWNNSVERPWGILSLFTTCLHAGVTVTWRLCKAGRFSYGESPWTPPLEGTSLHRWNNSVERPWGILSLFTTCLHAGVSHVASL